jgi:hypothetical protein
MCTMNRKRLQTDTIYMLRTFAWRVRSRSALGAERPLCCRQFALADDASWPFCDGRPSVSARGLSSTGRACPNNTRVISRMLFSSGRSVSIGRCS